MQQQRVIQGGDEGPQPLQPAMLTLGKPGWMVGGAIATLLTFTSTALAGPLTQWNFDQGSNQLELTVKTDQLPRYFMMAQPARIVVDLPNTQIQSPLDTQQTYDGPVRQIRISQFKPDQARIVIELSPDAVLAPGQVKLERSNQGLVVRPLLVDAAPVAAAPTVTPPPATAPLVVPPIDLPPDSTDAPAIPPADPTTGMLLPPTMESSSSPSAVASPLPTTAPVSPETSGSVSIPIPVIPPPTAADPATVQPALTTDLPPASFTTPASSSVTVPPLAQPTPSAPTELSPNTPFIVLPSSTPTPLSLPTMVGAGSSNPTPSSPAAALNPANSVSQPQTVSAVPAQPEMLTMPPVQPQTVTVPPVQSSPVTVPPIQAPTVTVPPVQPPVVTLSPAQSPTVQVPPVDPPVITIPSVAAPAVTAPASSLPVQPQSQPSVAVIQPEAEPRSETPALPAIRIPILEFGQPLPKSGEERVPSLNGQLAPTLPPPEPGAILLPVEGPGPR